MRTPLTVCILCFVLLTAVPWTGKGPLASGRGASAGISGEKRIEDLIRRYVAERLSAEPGSVRVRLLHPVEGVPPGDHALRLRRGVPGRDLLGRTAFRMTMETEAGRRQERWVSAEVSLIRPAVVSIRPLRRHHLIGPEDLEVLPIARSREGERDLDDPDILIGKRLKRSVARGMPITEEMVEDPPLIRRGTRIRLVVEAPGLKVMTLGQAKEEGSLGEVIAVTNLDSMKTVYGEVVDASTVRVRLGP